LIHEHSDGLLNAHRQTLEFPSQPRHIAVAATLLIVDPRAIPVRASQG
jgi:hypothetical protein